MKTRQTLRRKSIAVLVLLGLTASAYDFAVGDLFYNVNEDHNSVSVTYERIPYHGLGPYNTRVNGDVTIPASVTYNGKEYVVTIIGEYAFANCDMNSLSIPLTVNKIDNGAFSDCSMPYLEVPSSVTIIEKAFKQCNINSVKICGNIVSSKYAFYNSKGLKSVVFSDEITDLGYSIFEYCEYLTDVHLPLSLTKIPAYAFANCKNLSSIVIPNSVTAIGVKSFYGAGLFTITIPNNVMSIDSLAFLHTNLTSITIPRSVTSIGGHSFGTLLDDIYVEIQDPSTITVSKNAFEYVSTFRCVLHVPLGTKSLYQSIAPWNTFENIVEYNSNKPGDITGDGTVDIADVNAVINMMLGKTSQTAAGDVNGDGTVDIADVNAVINIMLGKQ